MYVFGDANRAVVSAGSQTSSSRRRKLCDDGSVARRSSVFGAHGSTTWMPAHRELP